MTAQAPIHSGFSARSTAKDVLGDADLTGKVAIVTGGYSGIGIETSRALVDAGATVIVPARDLDKARRTLAGIAVELEAMDLADPRSIDAFAERFLASKRPLHILIDSAGIMAPPLSRDARGFESQLAVNHLGHFQLATRLFSALQAANGARVVSVSSRGHHRGEMDFEDPNFERRAYDPWVGYGQSKTANILFAVGLDRRGAPHGIRAFSLHPGAIFEGSDLSRHMTPEQLASVGVGPGGAIDPAQRHLFKTPAEGAATQVWCATSEQLDGMGGVYAEDCDLAQLVDEPGRGTSGVRPYAIDPESAERLWALSERWIA